MVIWLVKESSKTLGIGLKEAVGMIRELGKWGKKRAEDSGMLKLNHRKNVSAFWVYVALRAMNS